MTSYLLAGGGTSGHINPMLAFADYIKSQETDPRIIIIGTKQGLESEIVPKKGHSLNLIPKTDFPRRIGLDCLLFLPKLFIAIRKVGKLVKENNIQKIVGFGGYVSIPAYLYAKIYKIDFTINESNAKPGLANKFGANQQFKKWQKAKVTTVFPNTKLSKEERVIGFPLREEIIELSKKRDKFLISKIPRTPKVLITGGSTGAQKLNEEFSKNYDLFKGIDVILQCGKGKIVENKDKLPKNFKVVEFIENSPEVLSKVDIVISRAGSGIVNEILALRKPSILVPLTYGNGEQIYNTEIITKNNGGIVIPNEKLNRKTIENIIIPLVHNTKKRRIMSKNLESKAILNANELLYSIVNE